MREITRGRLPIAYVNTTNLHITLNFFGELTDDELEKVQKNLADTVRDQKPFKIIFDKLIKFHQQIHMTLKPNRDLAVLQAKMQKAFEEAGFNFQDRPYYAHVKLANLHMDRVMNPQRKIESFPYQELEQLSFIADRVVLFESKLLLHHSHHYELLEQRLL